MAMDVFQKHEVSYEDEGWGEMTSEAIQAACRAAAPRNILVRHPLLRRIYLVFFIFVSLLFLLPAWVIIYLPRSRRPRSSWTLERCLRVRWSRRICGVVARCEIDYLGRDLSKDPDPMKLLYSHPVTIPPAPLSILRGHPEEMLDQLHESRGAWQPHFVHRLNRYKPGVWGKWNTDWDKTKFYGFDQVKAFWFTGKKASPDEGPAIRQPGQPVMLHFHGGGYLMGTAAESDLTSTIPRSLVEYSPVHHVLSVDYRLASKAPWPLPLLDAITAYHWLVTHENVPEKEIVIVGDSAGGHLALALTRWLRDEGPRLGFKGARGLVVMSPWTDLGFTNVWGKENIRFNADSDTVDNTFGPFAVSLLLRAHPASLIHTSPYLSPASLLLPSESSGPLSFQSFPPTYVINGGAERLASSVNIFWSRLQLARKAEKAQHKTALVADCRVEVPDAVHDFLIFPWMQEEAAAVYENLDGWLRELLSAEPEEEEPEPPLSPQEAASPDWRAIVFKRRESRRAEREFLKIGKSPIMRPTPDDRGPMRMVDEMRSEAMSMIDMPPLDLDSVSLPNTETAAGWITPFTSQYERGEWDWDEPDRAWYEIEGAGSGSGSHGDSDGEEENADIGAFSDHEYSNGESRKDR